MPDLSNTPAGPPEGATDRTPAVAVGSPTEPSTAASTAFPQPRSAPDDLAETVWDLTLYVTGATMLSARAIGFVRQLCDEHLHDRHRLTVIDVSDDVAGIPVVGVLAAPSLVRRYPLPERRWYGDLSDADRVLVGLQITTRPTGPAAPRTHG